MRRRRFLLSSLGAGTASLLAPGCASQAAAAVRPFELNELTVSDLAAGLKSGRYTARSLVTRYLARIEEIDRRGPLLRSVIEVNPEALRIADALDAERKQKGPRGPLHGIPILIKDNIDTGDRMLTSAGSLALADAPAPRDAFLVERLRAAGAVLLGKTNLSEWANIRSSKSTSGWSARGGQTRNPYELSRNPSGSSSGSGAAVSANLCAIAIGTETDGSITSPACSSGIVGLKPTVGLLSRSGIVPISHTQDTAGPMTRTVADAAVLLSALTGVDPRDPATAASRGKSEPDYTKYLQPNGLRGARIGVTRQLFGFNDNVDRLMTSAIETIRKLGAEVIDPVEFPSFGQFGDAELDVLLYELKADLAAYLATRGDRVAVHSLKDVIAFNERNREKELAVFGQDLFLKAEAKGPLTDEAYLKALEKCRRLSREQGIDAVMDKHRLDALVSPTGAPAWKTDWANGDSSTGGSTMYAAVAGYPHISVPAGFVFDLPVNISFFGRAWSEGKLIQYAYAFEQQTKARKPPQFLAPRAT